MRSSSSAHARTILDARMERIYQRAVHARALADGMTEVAAQARAELGDADPDEHGPMAQLARALDLDALRCDVVWSIVACSYDPRVSSHLEAMVGASGRRGLSVSAYCDLSGLDSSRGLDLARWLDAPTNLLVSTGLLIAAEPASPAERAYVASSRLVSFLAGDDAPESPVHAVGKRSAYSPERVPRYASASARIPRGRYSRALPVPVLASKP